MAIDTNVKTREPRKPQIPEPVREARQPDRNSITVGGRTFTRDIHTMNSASLSPYDIPEEVKPPGMTYQWKRRSVAGQVDDSYLGDLQRRGWQFVPADRHPGRAVEHDGLVLMEIPTQWLRESEERDRRAAQAERRNGKPDFSPSNGFERRAVRGLMGGRHEAPGRADPSLQPVLSTIDE